MITVRPNIRYDCDVLIAGGGPAGSGLAYHLASHGVKVVVAEAKKFPRDKVCGDGVSPIALAELHHMGITGTDQFELANEIDKVGLYIRDEKVFVDLAKPDELPYHARIIPRLELDNWIYEAAKKAGARYLESTRVTGYETTADAANVTLQTKSKKTMRLKARVIVGADGGNSTVAHQLRGRKPYEEFQLLGLRSYYDGVNGPRDRVDIFFSEESFPGIFWFFPKGKNGANIGIAMVSQTLPDKPSHVKDLLMNHISTNPDIARRIGNGRPKGKINGWPITFFNPESQITDHRLMLTGEAAGLINPLSGDGIQYALLSARWASESLIECLKQDDFSRAGLASYRKRVIDEVGYDFALSNLMVQFPRNKTLSKLWMTILSVMISRAKKDHNYATTIAGIFEGTYPSYHALTLPFIVKSLEEGGIEAGEFLGRSLNEPSTLIQTGANFSEGAVGLVGEILENPGIHGAWAMKTLGKTVSVAGYMAKGLLNRNGRGISKK